jgi:hypothetical protein
MRKVGGCALNLHDPGYCTGAGSYQQVHEPSGCDYWLLCKGIAPGYTLLLKV